MLNKLRRYVSDYVTALALLLHRLGFMPTHLTILGFLTISLSILPIIFLKYPLNILIFIILIVTSGLFDMLDGALARNLNLVSDKGGFLDSTLDRFTDSIIFIYLLILDIGIDPVLILICATTSLLISYIRSRAENIGINLQGVGIMERAERILFIIGALSISIYYPILDTAFTLLAILNVITIIHRIYHVLKV